MKQQLKALTAKCLHLEDFNTVVTIICLWDPTSLLKELLEKLATLLRQCSISG